jgi:3-dehydroquinate synthase
MSTGSLTYQHSTLSQTHILFENTPQFFHELNALSTSIFLVDDGFYKLNISLLEDKNMILVPSGESAKNWHTLGSILQKLLEFNLDVKSNLVGVGGGSVLDLTGFIASIYKRGIKHAFVPTTLLAMVDAAYGGKNGINMGELKNMVGTIKQPEKIWICPDWLIKLPEQEWKQGFAEIIKHALIRDIEMVNWLETKTLNEVCGDATLWLELIRRNVKIKMELVETDVYDQGDRRLLNFGHTVGHAIESAYQMPHGDAVSIGMYIETQLGVLMGLIDESVPNRIQQILKRYQLPFEWPIDPERCWQNLVQDKKKEEGRISWIVFNSIGSASLQSVSLETLKPHFFKLLGS